MQSRYRGRPLFGWPCWSILALAGAATLPIAALFMSAVEGTANSTEPEAALLNTERIHIHPVRPELPPAATGKLVVHTYNLADLVEMFRNQSDQPRSNPHLEIEWFVKRAAPGPWKNADIRLADPCQIERLTPGMQEAVKANQAARFELGWVNDKLIVVHTAAGHELIANRLESLARDGLAQLSVEVRLLSGPAIALDKFCRNWELIGATASDLIGSEPHLELPSATSKDAKDRSGIRFDGEVQSVVHKSVPAILAFLSEDEARALIQAAQDHVRSNIISAPKITLFNDESARIEDTTQRPFVVGVRAAEGGGHQPVIQVVSEGTSIRVRPALRGDGEVQLELGLTLSDIRNVETVEVPFAGERIGVQIPEVAIKRVQSNVVMKLDQMLAIAFPAVGSEKGTQPGCILVKVRKIEEGWIADRRSRSPTDESVAR